MAEFGNRIYELRKKMGLSQEKMAEKLNVSRQTLSKWELNESTPDMEKLIVMSDLFGISLDELMLGKEAARETSENHASMTDTLIKKTLTEDNKRKAKKIGKLSLIIFGILLAVDFISMIIYFAVFGVITYKRFLNQLRNVQRLVTAA